MRGRACALTPGLKAAHNNLALTFAAAGDSSARVPSSWRRATQAAAAYNIGIVNLAEQDYYPPRDAFEEAIKARPAFTAAKTRAHAASADALTDSQ